MSLPTRADVLVNCVPASCMPSPESPQKRTVADSTGTTPLADRGELASEVPIIESPLIDLLKQKSAEGRVGRGGEGLILEHQRSACESC